MEINHPLANILDETIKAFGNLDLESLVALEERVEVFAECNTRLEQHEMLIILPKKRQLEILLQNSQVNLDVLTRLHARNMREQWAL